MLPFIKRRRRIRIRASGKQEKTRKNSRTIFERLSAAFLPSYGGQHGENIICIRGVPGITGTFGRPTAISIQLKRCRVPHHHVEAAVDWCRLFLVSALSLYCISF